MNQRLAGFGLSLERWHFGEQSQFIITKNNKRKAERKNEYSKYRSMANFIRAWMNYGWYCLLYSFLPNS